MALFGRGNNVDSVPQEVKDYYEAERRERSGVAWLLALATLVVTLVLAGGIFLGGRWAYRKVVSRDKPATVATTTSETSSNNQSQQPATPVENKPKEDNTATPAPATNDTPSAPSTTTPATPAPTPAPATPTPTNNTGNSTGTSSTSTDTPSTPAATNPSSAQPSQLTNTGPGDTLGIFAVAVVVGTLGHYVVTTRRGRSAL